MNSITPFGSFSPWHSEPGWNIARRFHTVGSVAQLALCGTSSQWGAPGEDWLAMGVPGVHEGPGGGTGVAAAAASRSAAASNGRARRHGAMTVQP